jgi:hypothetical protein
MSYSSLGLLPDKGAQKWPDIAAGQGYKNFAQSSWDASEVYVFRANAYGIPIPYNTIFEAYQLLDAYIASMPIGNRNQDIIAITLKADGPAGLTRFEIIFTDAGGMHFNAKDSTEIADRMQKNLIAMGSKVEISNPAFAWVIDSQRVAFWLGKPRLWQYARYQQQETNLGAGNTDYRSKGGGVWGDSTALSPNREIAPYQSPPIRVDDREEPIQGEPGTRYQVEPGTGKKSPSDSDGDSALPLVLAIGIGAAAAYWISQQKERGVSTR